MIKHTSNILNHLAAVITACSTILSGCEQEVNSTTVQSSTNETQATITANIELSEKEMTSKETEPNEASQTQFNVGNKSYLFDVSDHTLKELQALLERAEEITQSTTDNYDKLEIVMILHGPDIDWFKQENYERNKHMVDLAARLDANEIIDLKVCETTMSSLGVERDEIPPFIESVPYAPDEMKRLLQEDYINL